MRRSARLLAGLGACTAIGAAGLLFSCLADPREDEAVKVINTCDTSLLSTDPKSVDSTLRAYVDTSKQLLAAVKEADTALRDVCVDISKDPGLALQAAASTGSASAACAPLLARIAKTAGGQPPPPGLNVIPPWVVIQFGERCAVPVGSREKCLAACAGPCDVSNCEDPNKISGTCSGECLGTCTTIATDLDAGVPCVGNCVGEVPIPNTGGATPGGTCLGECTGTCGNGIYTGNCEGACAGGKFKGVCAGTCTGKCNTTPINLDALDAGAPGAPDAEAGAALQDPPPPPNNAPGNCGTGTCEGSCSYGAYGSCYSSRCVTYDAGVGSVPYTTTLAAFAEGECTGSVCVGTCRAANGNGAVISTGSQGAPGTCKGECTEFTKFTPGVPDRPNGTACTGTCRARPNADADAGTFCSVDLDPTTKVCEGTLKCGQNVECSNACEAKASLDTVCTDPFVMQAYSVTDPALYAALQKFATPLGKAVAKLHKAQRAYSFIGNRNYGDFVALGAKGDLAYACAKEGAANTSAAKEILEPTTGVDPTTVRYVK